MIKIAMLAVFYWRVFLAYSFILAFLIALGTILNVIYWINDGRTNFVDGAITMATGWAILIAPFAAFLHLYFINFNRERKEKYRNARTIEEVSLIHAEVLASVRIFIVQKRAKT